MLRLLLPALIPSWRFFDTIGPSPRIEFAVVERPHDPVPDWQEFRPRPARVSLATMVLRLFWNPRWNESLYLVSCAENLLEGPSAFSERELLKRVANDDQATSGFGQSASLRVRVCVLKREHGSIAREILFASAPRRLDELRHRADR